MRWLDLLFAHWPVDPAELAARLPPSLELDTWDDRAWIGVIPFTMDDVRPRHVWLPRRLTQFPELNVRTYVRRRDDPTDRGVWFFSLDAMSWTTVWGSRLVFHLPDVHARMSSESVEGKIRYRSERDDRAWPGASFGARYRPIGPAFVAEPGSFDDWATNRVRLFSVDSRGRLIVGAIAHNPWPLQPADGDVDATELLASHGIAAPNEPPHLRFSARLDVRAWLPTRAAKGR